MYYAFPVFEPRKNFKKCVVSLLGDDQRLSSAMRFQNGKMRLFESMKRTVLSILIAFLESCSSKAPGYGLKTDFSETKNNGRHTRLFNENSLHEMFEALDIDAIDNVSPFLSALVVAHYGLSRSNEVTSAMNEYADMVSLVFKSNMNFE